MAEDIKKYKNGLVLGKFHGLHLGHLYLINTALKHCEFVYVLCCSIKSEVIPGEYRFKWLKQIYNNTPNIKVVHVTDEAPQKPEDDPENFWQIWYDIVYKNVDTLDVVFTSEDYGDPFAKVLGIKHHLVDKDRTTVPVSGTKVRTETFKYWEYIPDNTKSYYTKKVAILGPESCGKTTLTENLAKHYNTSFTEEYGRTVWVNRGGKLYIDDFIDISYGRQKLENKALLESNKILICDTEDITTYVFSEIYCPSDWKKTQEWFLEKINKNNYDLYILLSPDCEAVQDGTRNYLSIRQKHFDRLKLELESRGLNYIVIGGDWNNRFSESVKIIDKTFFDI